MKRNSSFDFSLHTALDLARGTEVLVEYASEFTGEHGEQEFDFALRQFLPGLNTPFFLTAGVKRQNEELTSFLYGVGASEQLSNRAAYEPGRVFIPYISGNAIFGVTERISLFVNTSLTLYPKKVLDSPIVKNRKSVNLVGGVVFNF